MENKFQIKWETIEDPETQPRSLRKLKTLDFAEFKNNVLSQEQAFVDDLVDSLYAGDAYILKNAFPKNYLSDLISRTFEYGKQSESTYHPMLEGCPDFHKIIDEEAAKKFSYSAVRHSFFFFPLLFPLFPRFSPCCSLFFKSLPPFSKAVYSSASIY